ncbi:transposable element Tcb2 transposase [Trichonephila clavipes]|nr:transposable element Tcb2 transposase [Trichonephila clavipes]
MEWPACSPDMNPIEHVWDALGRRVAGRKPLPQTLQELERAILEDDSRTIFKCHRNSEPRSSNEDNLYNLTRCLKTSTPSQRDELIYTQL